MNESARIVIIGGGVIGLAVAYHLAELGISDVILLERNQLGSGTSWHAAGIVGPLRASLNLTRLAQYATELFPRLEAQTGQSPGYRQTGGLWLARHPERMTELRRMARIGQMCDLSTTMIDPAEVAERVPGISVDGLEGALWVAEDGQANPVDLCAAYAKRARMAGLRIRENTSCSGLVTKAWPHRWSEARLRRRDRLRDRGELCGRLGTTHRRPGRRARPAAGGRAYVCHDGADKDAPGPVSDRPRPRRGHLSQSRYGEARARRIRAQRQALRCRRHPRRAAVP